MASDSEIQKVWVSCSKADSSGAFPRNVKMTLTGHYALVQPMPATKLTGTWICNKTHGPPKNIQLGQNTITLGNTTEGSFELASPPAGLQHGEYEFNVAVNGVKKKTVYFKIL